MRGAKHLLPVLLESIDGQNGQFLVLLGIRHQELVGHLLDDDILGDRNLSVRDSIQKNHDDRGEELRHIDSHGGEVDHAAHHVAQLHHVLLHIGIGQELHDETASQRPTAIISFTSPFFLGCVATLAASACFSARVCFARLPPPIPGGALLSGFLRLNMCDLDLVL